MTLRRGDGSVVRELGERRVEPRLRDHRLGPAELFTIPSADGKYQLPAYWVQPADFSPGRSNTR